MRCLICHQNGLPTDTDTCPACGVYLPAMMRDLLPSGYKLREYQIDYPIGRGGFGVTYRGMHTSLGCPVAIKEYFPQDLAVRKTDHSISALPDTGGFQGGLEEFIQEGQILAQVRHPGLVRVQNLFEENGTAYLVMDFVQGQSLKQLLKGRGGRLHIGEIEWVVEQIVEGVATLHEHSEPIVHLDLKPANILIEGSRVVLVDFGSAKLAGHRQGTVHITPEYAPLELLDREWGPESDVYELGVMVYEMLTGRRPPSVLDRIGGEREWRPGPEAEPWQEMLERALAERDKRPTDVRAWWTMRGQHAEAESASMIVRESAVPQHSLLPVVPAKQTWF